MSQTHQTGEFSRRCCLKTSLGSLFPPFRLQVRLAVMVGHPSEPGPYAIRVKAPGGTKPAFFYIRIGDQLDGNKIHGLSGWQPYRFARRHAPLPLGKGQ